ncbi:hypothetical protein DL93DRAFT_2234692 [Clavulina sp. PMI_390]|nr:hypothetical protein DL93DRAFT_2234692 [Clavulina sp. PMI_390]
MSSMSSPNAASELTESRAIILEAIKVIDRTVTSYVSPSPSPHYLRHTSSDTKAEARRKYVDHLDQIHNLEALLSEALHPSLELLKQRRLRLTNDLAPISSLPPEILSEILVSAVHVKGRSAASQILKLSQICASWRLIMLSMNKLYASESANWERWPIWLCKEWYSRSRNSLLTIRINTSAIGRIQREEQFQELFKKTVGRWEEIHLLDYQRLPAFGEEEFSKAGTVGHFFHFHSFPSLHSLYLPRYPTARQYRPWTGQSFQISPDNYPVLRFLDLHGAVATVPSGRTLEYLVSLVFRHCTIQASVEFGLLPQLPNLQDLSIYDATRPGPTHPSKLSLPVKRLSLHRCDVAGMKMLLGAWHLPNVQTLEINQPYFSAPPAFLEPSIDTIMDNFKYPNLTHLIINDGQEHCLRWARVLSRNPSLLPALENLALYDPTAEDTHIFSFFDNEPFEAALLTIASSRSLNTLQVSSVSDGAADELRRRVGTLEPAPQHCHAYEDYHVVRLEFELLLSRVFIDC